MRSFAWCGGLILFCLAGCGGSNSTSEPPPVPQAPALEGGASAPSMPSPGVFRVKFTTTKGDFVVEVHRNWSPNGADHFYELVQANYYDGCKFFRAVSGFMVQFGINGDPAQNEKWKDRRIPDDPVVKSNTRGFITYAKPSMPNARSTQLFINYGDNSRLDADGFSPFGEVVEGMDVVDSLNQEYGEEPSRYQEKIQEEGNAFLEKAYPRLDAIVTARIVE